MNNRIKDDRVEIKPGDCVKFKFLFTGSTHYLRVTTYQSVLLNRNQSIYEVRKLNTLECLVFLNDEKNN